MGRIGADGFAELVEDGEVQLRQALSWHLQANHYPPIPQAMIDPATQAIELASADIWDEDIDLPEGILYKGGPTAPVYDIIESLHLDSFLPDYG